MTERLPSLGSLIAFEAAARHLSFTRAAREINITQTAVSHQIKTLEANLGVRLFQRRRNGIQLTSAAKKYLESVRAALGIISDATGELTGTNRDVLNINCHITFGLKFLSPLLAEFNRIHPEITTRISYPTRFEQYHDRDFDVAVQYGAGNWEGYKADWLCDSEIFPVCSPQILSQMDLSGGPAELARFTRIHTPYFLCRNDWTLWLERAGVEDISPPSEMVFNLVIGSLQAALDGLGVAMGRSPLVDSDVTAGRLCIPFDLRLKSPFSYYLISPGEKAAQPMVRIFRNWLLEKFAGGRERHPPNIAAAAHPRALLADLPN